jgi:hypothetical protein
MKKTANRELRGWTFRIAGLVKKGTGLKKFVGARCTSTVG